MVFLPLIITAISLIVLLITVDAVPHPQKHHHTRTIIKLPQTSMRSVSLTKRQKCESQSAMTCYLQPTAGHKENGFVFYGPLWTPVPVPPVKDGKASETTHGCAVRVVASVNGLPAGKYSFHIHTYGDIREADGSGIGETYTKPTMLEADKYGFASTETADWGLKLGAIIGRSVAVDMKSDGRAGAVVATCVIGTINPNLSGH